MTDKQIIIDNVDASGCEWIREVGLDSEYICTCNSPNKTSGYCKDNPNCYYKQLKRKEQECEALKAELEQYKASKQASYEALQKKCNELELENRKLKEYQKLLEEQMKFNQSELELSLSSEINRSEFLLKEFKRVDKQKDNWREKAERYKQTLTEIKEIADAITNGYHFTNNIEEHLKESAKQILREISEAIDE